MILLIDNYDSFVYNLARYLRRLGQETRVVRNDAISPPEIAALHPQAVVLSPGPCTPHEAGCCLETVARLGSRLPMLGICLGHQILGAACGGRVVRAIEPVHGRTSCVYHDGQSIFAGIPNPLQACRYHSLIVDRPSLPSCLEILAWTTDQTIMALRHRSRPLIGLQFHPESILTACGYPLLVNFLRMAGLTLPADVPSIHDELAEASQAWHVTRTGGFQPLDDDTRQDAAPK